ncbi:MAG: hypothetical protein WBA62_19125 [Xanthobacteraceae bacterium]
MSVRKPRIWSSYVNSDFSKRELIRQIEAFDSLVELKLASKWKGVILTVMYEPLPGSHSSKTYQMKKQIEKLYSTFLTRVCRHPRSGCDKPILIGLADLPVNKYKKISILDATVNDGLHYHCILLVPPKSRLEGTIKNHFENEKRELYLGSPRVIDRIHIEPIVTKSSNLVTDYVFKAVARGLSYDEHLLILPKSESEVTK